MSLVLPNNVTPHHLASTSSTNDVAKELAKDGAAHLTLVYADQQTAGRGRMARPWQSPPGNLYMSLILRPDPNWPALPTLSHMTSLALCDAIAPLIRPQTNKRIEIKWPNDVLINGAKLSGILIEQSEGAIIVGVGMNINHHPDDLPYPATDLQAEGTGLDRDACLSKLVEAFVKRLKVWSQKGFPALREDYLKQAYRLTQEINVRTGTGEDRISGVYETVDEHGQMVLVLEGGGKRVISAGDVLAV